MQPNFYVAPKYKAMVDMVLGRSWIIKTNCSLDWVKRKYTLRLCHGDTLIGDCAPVHPSLQNLEDKDLLSLLLQCGSELEMHWIADITSKSSHGWNVPLPLLEAKGYGKASNKVLYEWLPKQA